MVYVANKQPYGVRQAMYTSVFTRWNTQSCSRCKLVFSCIQTVQHMIELLISYHFHKWYRRCSYHDDMGFFHYSSDRESCHRCENGSIHKCESGGCHNCCSYHKHGDVHVNCMHLLLQRLMMLQKKQLAKQSILFLLY